MLNKEDSNQSVIPVYEIEAELSCSEASGIKSKDIRPLVAPDQKSDTPKGSNEIY